MTSISVLITTRNRCDDVVRAVESCLAQTLAPSEFLIFDDASSDGTLDALSQFPQIRVIGIKQRSERLVLRNRGFASLTSDIVVVLDDDCYICEPTLFERTVAMMESDPAIGVVCFPMIEPSRPRNYMPLEPKHGAAMGSFLAGASAFRRAAIAEVDGYREFLVRHEEERDLSLRLIDRYWRLVYLGGSPIVHSISDVRDSTDDDILWMRNIILVLFLNFPILVVLPRCVISMINIVRFNWKPSITGVRLRGILAGLAAAWCYRKTRKPVSMSAYRQFRKLPKHGSRILGDAQTTPLSRTGDSFKQGATYRDGESHLSKVSNV